MRDSARRLTFIQQFSHVRRARDIYTTMHKNFKFKVMLWITVLNSVNMEDFKLTPLNDLSSMSRPYYNMNVHVTTFFYFFQS